MKTTLRISAFLLGAAVAGCSGDARLSDGLRVTVNVAPNSLSQCIRVIATPAGGTEAATRPIARKDEINVAVYRAKDWSGQVTLVARGYRSCNADTAVTDFIEESEPQTSATYAGQVTLNLLPKPVVLVDNDSDGKKGAEDCDDNDPARFFGNNEVCTSTVDNNCSQTTGCADPACTGGCFPADAGVCQGGVCRGDESFACADGQDNNGDGLTDCADPQCLNASCDDNSACTATDKCLGDGGCAGSAVTVSCGPAPSGTCLTGAGSCNPADGGCSYAARDAGLSCNDGDACGVQDRCLFDGGCAATAPFNCAAAPNQCFDAGVCTNPLDAGCTYSLRLASSCVDSRNCSVPGTGSCQADAGCVGAPVTCNSSGSVCKSDAGTCNPTNGLCVYANIANTTACDDSNACTNGTTCNNGTCGGGSSVTCTAADICFDAGTCSPPTGCSTVPVTCTPNECQAGTTCNAAMGGCEFTYLASGTACQTTNECFGGACLQTDKAFDLYTPDNFVADAGPVGAGVVIDCAAIFNTGTATTNASFSGCGGQLFTEAAGDITTGAQPASTLEAAVLRIRALHITDAGSLTIQGDRPAILAVFGDATVYGTINVHATGTTKGPGSNLNCNSAGINGAANTTAAAGAGGGGFAGAGGNGGDGDGFNTNGVGGTASGNLQITPLRGGCPGGTGAAPGGVSALPIGGGGGGALQISASRRLIVGGLINANGGGGEAGRSRNPFGESAAGGGSGGGIRLEANVMTFKSTMKLLANAGTGGEGGDTNGSLMRRTNGFDGQLGFGITRGPGDGVGGTNGGDGAGGTTINGDNAANAGSNNTGGGGGGGAVGRIYARWIDATASCRESGYLISPSTSASSGSNNAGFNLFQPMSTGAQTSCP